MRHPYYESPKFEQHALGREQSWLGVVKFLDRPRIVGRRVLPCLR